MLSPLVAALACVIAPTGARAVDGSAAMVTAMMTVTAPPAMSQPLEVGPLSSPPLEPLATLPPELVVDPGLTLARTLIGDDARFSRAGDDARLSRPGDDTRAPMSPFEVACDPVAAAAVPDCAGLSSHIDDAFGSCRLLAPARGLVAIFTRGGGHGAHHVGAGTIARAPELLIPDAHATPLLWPARLGLVHDAQAIALFAPPPTQPLPVPARRLDRPPRL